MDAKLFVAVFKGFLMGIAVLALMAVMSALYIGIQLGR